MPLLICNQRATSNAPSCWAVAQGCQPSPVWVLPPLPSGWEGRPDLDGWVLASWGSWGVNRRRPFDALLKAPGPRPFDPPRRLAGGEAPRMIRGEEGGSLSLRGSPGPWPFDPPRLRAGGEAPSFRLPPGLIGLVQDLLYATAPLKRGLAGSAESRKAGEGPTQGLCSLGCGYP